MQVGKEGSDTLFHWCIILGDRKNTFIIIVHNFVQCALKYCDIVWYLVSTCNTELLQSIIFTVWIKEQTIAIFKNH